MIKNEQEAESNFKRRKEVKDDQGITLSSNKNDMSEDDNTDIEDNGLIKIPKLSTNKTFSMICPLCHFFIYKAV